jgi:hypothetical protein
MSIEKDQSAIKEVRDQLSLDRADDKHLNVVTGNLGMPRPVIGFTDDLWRAVVKQIAVDYKQIRTQFAALLAILFGPQKTEVTTLSQGASVDDISIFLNRNDHVPQIGTIILDEGQPTEEAVGYCLIDRETGEAILTNQLTQDHLAYDRDAEQPIWFIDGTTVSVPTIRNFSTVDLPYTLVLGRGTPSEEVVSVVSVDADAQTLTLAAPPVNAHEGPETRLIDTALQLDYVAHSVTLHLDDTTQFPPSGEVLLGESGALVVDSGTVADITVSGVGIDKFVPGRLAGYILRVVDGPAAGEEIQVLGNTATVISFVGTLTAAPLFGNSFTLKPRVSYTSVDHDTNDLILLRPLGGPAPGEVFGASLPQQLTFLAGTQVELLRANATAAMGPVKFAGAGWDVIQSKPRKIDLLIPTLEFENDLRSASYLHTTYIDPVPVTSLDAPALAGDTEIAADMTGFPQVGVVTIGPPGTENVGYKIPLSAVLVPDLVNENLDFIIGGGLTPDAIVREAGNFLDDGFNPDQTIEITGSTSNDGTYDLIGVTDTALLVAPASWAAADADEVGVSIVTVDKVLLATGVLASGHAAADPVTLYQPRYGLTELLDGNIYDLVDVWPGPYVYKEDRDAPNGANGVTELASLLAGPTKVTIAQVPGHTAIEVQDATAFPFTGFPYDIFVGRTTGNEETLSLQDVALKQRTVTSVAAPGTSAGDTEIPVTALSLGPTAATFPDKSGYRVRLGVDTGDVEIVEVLSTLTGPDRLVVANTTNDHAAGQAVELVSDVLAVEQITDGHFGIIPDRNKASTHTEIAPGTALAPVADEPARDRADIVEVPYSELDVEDGSVFPPEGNVILNFGEKQIPVRHTLVVDAVPGDSSFELDDSDDLPNDPTDYPFVVTLSPNTTRAEVVLVTDNNTVTNVLTIASTLKFSHTKTENPPVSPAPSPLPAEVLYVPGQEEVLSYTSVDGDTLRFSDPFVVKFTHNPSEIAIPSTIKSAPRDNGFDFPFRMPASLLARLKFLFDLLRAAGVEVCFISKR